jgi:predicted esterase
MGKSGTYVLRTLCAAAAILLVNLGADSPAVTPPTPGSASAPAASAPAKPRIILCGTTIDPEEQIRQSQELAKKIAKPESPQWQAKGDQKRSYHFPDANADMPYRIVVPTTWDGKSKLPMAVMLHGAGGNESTYLDQSNKLLPRLAQEHGYLLVSPMGYSTMGAYGTCLRLPTVFGKSETGAQQRAAVDAAKEKTLELSEKDVINVIEIVANEYPIDRGAMFLLGHSMGSGGTWYLGGKYNMYWAAFAPMSGPFVEEANYPWDRIRDKPIFITEGTGATPSLEGSRKMQAWMKEQKFKVEYKEVEADHGGMVALVLPAVFDFFDQVRKKP